MCVFRRRNAGAGGAVDEVAAGDEPGNSSDRPEGAGSAFTPAKGRTTPKRSEAERKRRNPTYVKPGDKAGQQQLRARERTERARKYEAMKAGETWALNPRDRGPARALARDYIDSKRRISEFYMYILVVLLAAVFVRNKTAESYISPLVLVLVVIIVIDAQFIRHGLRKLISERLPGESTRGLTMYAVMRALQIRKFRVPAPRVRPGDKF